MGHWFVVSVFKRLILLFSLSDLKSTYSSDLLTIFLDAYSKKYCVIFINASIFSAYGGLIIKTITFKSDFLVKNKNNYLRKNKPTIIK